MRAPQLEFLGTGSAFTTDPDNFQSNLILRGTSGDRLLIDCGSDARRALYQRGLSAVDLSAVYVSHLHADHAGGLEWLGFTTHFDPVCPRLALYLAEPLAVPLWDEVLVGGMRHIVGDEARLETYFDVRPVSPRGHFEWDGVSLTIVPTPHVRGSAGTVTSYGLSIRGPTRTIYLTTDTSFEKVAELETADLVLHDCETSATPTNVHPPFETLARELSSAVRAKTWLYGYPPGDLPDAHAAGFLGFARPGQTFEL